MPLIECPDCGRQVSDAAVACPRCARPIADFEGASTALPRRFSAPSSGPPRAIPVMAEPVAARSSATPQKPPALLALEQQLRDARVPASPASNAPKLCIRCRADVSLDAFRQREGDGYLCTDCQDSELDRANQRSKRIRALLAILLMICVAGAIPVAVIYTISHVQVTTRPK